jgi:hypothetical protein
MEYRGYVHKERRAGGVWIALFCQLDQGERTVLDVATRPRHREAWLWARDRTRDAYDSISLAPSKSSVDGVRLPKHCLWCGRLLRYSPNQAYCTGHRSKARKSRPANPYNGGGCRTPEKAAYLHRGTAIMTARLLELDCYLCARADRGCNAYHLTSANEGGILDLIRKSQQG